MAIYGARFSARNWLIAFLLSVLSSQAIAQVVLSPNVPVCEANTGTAGGQQSTFNPDTNSARAKAEGGAAGTEHSSFSEVGLRFKASATMNVALSVQGIWPRGQLEGFGNINEGSYKVRVILRDITNSTEVASQLVFDNAENGGFATKKIKVINEVLTQGEITFDVNLVGGREFEIIVRLETKANGLIGESDFMSGESQVTYGCVSATMADSDGDGLPDQWEQSGIDTDGDGSVDFSLQNMGTDYRGVVITADPLHKDLFVELDFFDCAVAGGDCAPGDAHVHRPRNDALELIRQSFANAPVQNPDGVSGVNLWVLVDESLAHQAFCELDGTCFDLIKPNTFGTAAERAQSNAIQLLSGKRQVFRYNLWVHDRAPGNTSSGRGEGANDFIVSLGSWASQVGDQFDQAGTFMHELGHTLRLGHGGGDGTNCKPNYLSIMSYTWQVSGLQPTDVFDYSRAALPNLNENALNETLGIQDGGFTTAFGPGFNVGAGTGPIDWNVDSDVVDVAASVDINNVSSCDASPGQVLTGFDDWSNIKYNFRDSKDFADGVHNTAIDQELDFESAERLKQAHWRAKTKTIYEYAAKFICGVQKDPQPLRLARGAYATIINLHNPNDERVTFFRKLALAYPPESEQPGKIIEIGMDSLRYDEAFKVDCESVRQRVFKGVFPADYIEGYLIVQSDKSIDANGVYTTAALNEQGLAGDHSSIHLETVRERVRKLGLPDLVPVPTLPAPSAGLPEGSPGVRYCVKSAAGGAAKGIRVRVVNQGAVASAESMLSVDFVKASQVAVPVPKLEPGAGATLDIVIPQGCYPGSFSSQCRFRIRADGFGQIKESNESNNTVESFCASPAG